MFVAEDKFDSEEALVAAVIRRKFLLERMLEDIQHIPDEVDEENNACVPYRLGLTIMLMLRMSK